MMHCCGEERFLRAEWPVPERELRAKDCDETFIILDGTMVMHFRDGVVELSRGEMIVIPKGVEH